MVFKRQVMRVAFLLILSTLLVLSSCGTSKLSVTVSPSSREVYTGDTVTFNVLIDTEILTRGAQCTLAFDPDIITCIGVSEGNFYKDWAAAKGCTTVVYPEPTIDNTNGRVSDLGVAILGETEGGVKGTGVLFTYHFDAIGNGVVAPNLSNIIISNKSGNSLEVQ